MTSNSAMYRQLHGYIVKRTHNPMYMIFNSLWTLPGYININSKGAIILVSHDIEGSILSRHLHCLWLCYLRTIIYTSLKDLTEETMLYSHKNIFIPNVTNYIVVSYFYFWSSGENAQIILHQRTLRKFA